MGAKDTGWSHVKPQTNEFSGISFHGKPLELKIGYPIAVIKMEKSAALPVLAFSC